MSNLRITIDNITARLVAMEQYDDVKIPQIIYDELASIERIAEGEYSPPDTKQTEFRF